MASVARERPRSEASWSRTKTGGQGTQLHAKKETHRAWQSAFVGQRHPIIVPHGCLLPCNLCCSHGLGSDGDSGLDACIPRANPKPCGCLHRLSHASALREEVPLQGRGSALQSSHGPLKNDTGHADSVVRALCTGGSCPALPHPQPHHGVGSPGIWCPDKIM